MQSVLVTGATGYIATHTILALIENGYSVRGTVRSLAHGQDLVERLSGYAEKPISFELAEADLSKDEGWKEAMDGIDYVLHLASPAPLILPDNDNLIVEPARDGTVRVLEAARDSMSVKRVVITSSVTAITHGCGPKLPETFNESHWTDPTNLTDTTAYSRSKVVAERAAWSFVSNSNINFDLVCLHPTLVLGPVMGPKFAATLSFVSKLMAGEVPLIPSVGYQVIDVRDAALAHVRALQNADAGGNRFILSGEFLWMKDVANILRSSFDDRSFPRFSVPNSLLHLAGRFEPSLKNVMIDVGRRRIASSEQAQKHLGWCPRPAEESVLDCAHSLVRHGVV